MLSFALYVIGSVVCIAGLAWVATLIGVAGAYVTGAAMVLFCAAIVLALVERRAIEPPPA